MKTGSMTFALTLAAFSSFAFAAEEKVLSAKQVPQAIHEAFQKAYPAAQDAGYSEETRDGKTAYEVEFKNQGKKLAATYSAEGALIESEEEIKTAELPEAVVSEIKKAHPHATMKEAEKVLTPDGTVSGYEVEIVDGKKRLELEFDASGAVVKKADEKDGKE